MSSAREQFYARPALKGVPDDLVKAPGLFLFTMDTPNGKKTQIALEEIKDAYPSVEWSWIGFNIGTNYQHSSWYKALDPNGKIPLLIDNAPPSSNDGKPFVIRESGAQLLYLAKEYDSKNLFGFSDEFERNECLQWQFFQAAHGGPMQGQFNHFNLYAPEKIPYAIDRYHKETLRIYGVLESHLSGSARQEEPREYLAGAGKGKYSWADIQTIGWPLMHERSGVTAEEWSKFPHLNQWLERVKARPAVQRALTKYQVANETTKIEDIKTRHSTDA